MAAAGAAFAFACALRGFCETENYNNQFEVLLYNFCNLVFFLASRPMTQHLKGPKCGLATWITQNIVRSPKRERAARSAAAGGGEGVGGVLFSVRVWRRKFFGFSGPKTKRS